MSEIAWAAGLFDGEGSIHSGSGWLKLQLKMVEEQPVRRFAAAVERGNVGGPYVNNMYDGYPRRDFYVWYTLNGQAVPVLQLLWPYLSDFRQEQAIALGFTPKYVETAP